MFSTPLICSSSGTTTLLNTTSAFAPWYDAATTTVGGAISGYCDIGSEVRPSTPRIKIMMEITVDRTGRSINLFSIKYHLEISFEEMNFTFNRPKQSSYNQTVLRQIKLAIT